jgi:hypothetical protein
VPHQKYNPAKDPDWWHRGYQRKPYQQIKYDPKCRVCGERYRPGEYSYHAAKNVKHKAALVPKHKVKK